MVLIKDSKNFLIERRVILACDHEHGHYSLFIWLCRQILFVLGYYFLFMFFYSKPKRNIHNFQTIRKKVDFQSQQEETKKKNAFFFFSFIHLKFKNKTRLNKEKYIVQIHNFHNITYVLDTRDIYQWRELEKWVCSNYDNWKLQCGSHVRPPLRN